ncbi:alkaline phosphatase-like protein, partial [Aureobasidium melanogenum]
LMAHTSFFALGNSNAISSIDLSNAYNGVSGYNVVAVGVLLFASNWAGPIYWSTCAAVLFTLPSIEQEEAALDRLEKAAETQRTLGNKKWIHEERELLHQQAADVSASALKQEKKDHDIWHEHISIMSIFISASLVAVMVACTVLRTHLFIWTVFSPKYLYAMAWAVAWHLIVNIGLGGVLWSVR